MLKRKKMKILKIVNGNNKDGRFRISDFGFCKAEFIKISNQKSKITNHKSKITNRKSQIVNHAPTKTK
jgi:hypothetical protein